MNRAHLTITRPTCSDGSRFINIEIGDRDSSLMVLRLRVTLEDFALALTGMGHTPASVEHWCGKYADRIGKHSHNRTLLIPESASYEKEKAKAWVRAHPLVVEAIAAGWELWDDGTRSQQNDRGHHHIHLRRYEDHPQERAKGVRP